MKERIKRYLTENTQKNMKKNVIFVLVIIIVGWVLVNYNRTTPPELKIRYENKYVNAIQGTYSWKSLFKSVHSDSPAMSELAEKMEPTVVEPGAPMKISFKAKPENIEVRMQKDDKTITQEVEQYIITTPNDNGIYIYELIGEWKQGQVSYVFRIDVHRR